MALRFLARTAQSPGPSGGSPVGWLLALVAVATVAWLAVPRRIPPHELPGPRVVRPLLAQELAHERELARRAHLGLPAEVRAVGELVRRVGLAEASGNAEAVVGLRQELRAATERAARVGGGARLLELRAVQTRLFVEAIMQAETTGQPGTPLRELGGTLPERARAAGWKRGRSFLASEAELSALFRIRWGRLTELLATGPFAPSLNDWRLYYGHRLRFPDAGVTEHERLEGQLRDVRALAQLDGEYPEEYAAGVVLLRLGAFDLALQQFRAHLAQNPNGEWTLRARNYAHTSAAALAGR